MHPDTRHTTTTLGTPPNPQIPTITQPFGLEKNYDVLKRFVMSFYYVRHALQTIQVSPPARGDLKNTQEHRFLVFLKFGVSQVLRALSIRRCRKV